MDAPNGAAFGARRNEDIALDLLSSLHPPLELAVPQSLPPALAVHPPPNPKST